MIELGLRLAVSSRAARLRLMLVAVGVGVGTLFLLGSLGYMNARDTMNHRVATRDPLTPGSPHGPGILWASRPVSDIQGNTAYTLYRTAPGSGRQPAPLGTPAMPAPGTAYVSPAVAALMRSHPHGAEWRALVPWKVVGTISRAGLHDPDERVVIAGYRHDQLAPTDIGARRVASWQALSDAARTPGLQPDQVIPFAMALALGLTPIAIFVASAARIGQRRRDERAAALRLLGASARQLAFLASAETAVAALIGAVGGVAVIELLRMRTSVGLGHYVIFTADAVPAFWQLVVVLVGLPLFTAMVAWVALTRSISRPLATRRRSAASVPRAWRIALPAIGWAGMALVLTHPTALQLTQRALALAVFGSLILLGVVLTGGYLVRYGARLLRALPPAAATIAGRRLEADSTGGFRAISGLAVALTVTCAVLVVGASQSAVANANLAPDAPAQASTIDDLGVPTSGNARMDRQVRAIVLAQRGVRAVAPVTISFGTPTAIIADCGELARLAGRPLDCAEGVLAPQAAGAVGAPITIQFAGTKGTPKLTTHIGARLPAGVRLAGAGDSVQVIVPKALEPKGVDQSNRQLAVDTGKSQLVQDRVIGALARAIPAYLPVYTYVPAPAENTDLQRLEVLLTAIALLVMGIAAASLAIGAIEGVLERRRTLAHMSATGVPAGTLRSATVLEIAAPMVAALVLGVAIGIGTGATFIHFYDTSGTTPIAVPWRDIALLALAAAAATGFVVVATLPMVGRSIGPDGLRTE